MVVMPNLREQIELNFADGDYLPPNEPGDEPMEIPPPAPPAAPPIAPQAAPPAAQPIAPQAAPPVALPIAPQAALPAALPIVPQAAPAVGPPIEQPNWLPGQQGVPGQPANTSCGRSFGKRSIPRQAWATKPKSTWSQWPR
ncbi:proline-rich protein 36-like [Venturia canescens]|uniref:proline-rich protein 36-like n=1 Tax=Venturia canescens TaxID=32260 RepID=UPI001C9C4CF4|nr:proline-rich protein 36-like [Venturia canescens]